MDIATCAVREVLGSALAVQKKSSGATLAPLFFTEKKNGNKKVNFILNFL